MSRTVLLEESGESARPPRRLPRPLWTRPLATIQRRPALTLTAFARAKRRQLDALMVAEVTASLRLEVEGRTRLASLLPTRERLPGPVARRGVHRVFALHGDGL
ncbi:MAG: hypothetical protein JXB05_23315 [Myxococcaceae bacterium]|nr:hypothetical protein [Myxococcaceae bacterium]